MDIQRKSGVATFGVAILAFSTALAFRILGWSFLEEDSPFLFFIAALSLASWYGGFGPGILATLLGAIAVALLFLPPITQSGTLAVNHVVHIGVYILTGFFISALMKKQHGAIERSVKAERELESRVQERTNQLAEAYGELEAEKNKLLGILDQMPEAVYIVNPQYGIEYTNPAMDREFGPVNGQKCYQYLGGQESAVCSRCRNPEIFKGLSFSQEWTSPQNGKIYDCFDAPIVIKGTPCKLKIMHDITGLKTAEEELRTRHKEIQRLSSELLTAQEAERLRISRELHDELGQSLSLIKLQIGIVAINLAESQQSLREFCDDASTQVDLAIENMRRLSRDLSPVTVETLGVTVALRRLAEDINQTGRIRISSDIDNIDGLFSPQSNILLYRILQEGLNNIIKHSGASIASISLKRLNGKIHFTLTDNGRGADRGRVSGDRAKANGLGLTTMKERVRTLGGELMIHTGKNTGMEIRFLIPVTSEAKGNDDL